MRSTGKRQAEMSRRAPQTSSVTSQEDADDLEREPLLSSATGSDQVETQASTPSDDTAYGSFRRRERLPAPGSLRDSLWNWVPTRGRQIAHVIKQWAMGPVPPKVYLIAPIFPVVQQAPPRLIQKYLPERRHKSALLGFFYASWLLTFSLVLQHSARAGNISGYGKPDNIWCGASFWGPNNDCGLNGNHCRPFENTTLAFRCPANCRATHVLNPRAIGDKEVNYKPFVIGGPIAPEENSSLPDTIYRGDSFICQAAIHSGIVGNDKGGCGVALLTGEQTNFTATRRHGIQSFAFDSSFPKTFTFVKGLSSQCVRDLRWPLLAVTCGFTTILSLFTTSPSILFFSIFPMLFFHVGLVSDPPNHADFPTLISIIIGRFLPAMFVAVVFYRYSVKPQQTGLTANMERTVLWVGGAWVGALNNYTFDFIPIQRLTPTDIRAQAGAVLALIVVVLLIFLIALQQAWYLRQEGRFCRYLAIYGLMVAGLLLCVLIPQLNLRIHHYFLAILLLPGTRTQTRPSLLYQGILVGLFINGTARWGFDSIMQTAFELRGSDGQKGSVLPNITAPILSVSNITFNWAKPPPPYDGLSVLVNDVERHKWYRGEGFPGHTFERFDQSVREYFRFAFLRGSGTGDYTKAGTWETDGSWTQMGLGPG